MSYAHLGGYHALGTAEVAIQSGGSRCKMPESDEFMPAQPRHQSGKIRRSQQTCKRKTMKAVP